MNHRTPSCNCDFESRSNDASVPSQSENRLSNFDDDKISSSSSAQFSNTVENRHYSRSLFSDCEEGNRIESSSNAALHQDNDDPPFEDSKPPALSQDSLDLKTGDPLTQSKLLCQQQVEQFNNHLHSESDLKPPHITQQSSPKPPKNDLLSAQPSLESTNSLNPRANSVPLLFIHVPKNSRGNSNNGNHSAINSSKRAPSVPDFLAYSHNKHQGGIASSNFSGLNGQNLEQNHPQSQQAVSTTLLSDAALRTKERGRSSLDRFEERLRRAELRLSSDDNSVERHRSKSTPSRGIGVVEGRENKWVEEWVMKLQNEGVNTNDIFGKKSHGDCFDESTDGVNINSQSNATQIPFALNREVGPTTPALPVAVGDMTLRRGSNINSVDADNFVSRDEAPSCKQTRDILNDTLRPSKPTLPLAVGDLTPLRGSDGNSIGDEISEKNVPSSQRNSTIPVAVGDITPIGRSDDGLDAEQIRILASERLHSQEQETGHSSVKSSDVSVEAGSHRSRTLSGLLEDHLMPEPPPLPPPATEKERLVERERQGRLEQERARRRHIALLRDRLLEETGETVESADSDDVRFTGQVSFDDGLNEFMNGPSSIGTSIAERIAVLAPEFVGDSAIISTAPTGNSSIASSDVLLGPGSRHSRSLSGQIIDTPNIPRPPLPPPPATERERLVERERQARLEAERARCRHLALQREREREMETSGIESGNRDNENSRIELMSPSDEFARIEESRADFTHHATEGNCIRNSSVSSSPSTKSDVSVTAEPSEKGASTKSSQPAEPSTERERLGDRDAEAGSLSYTMERFLETLGEDERRQPPVAAAAMETDTTELSYPMELFLAENAAAGPHGDNTSAMAVNIETSIHSQPNCQISNGLEVPPTTHDIMMNDDISPQQVRSSSDSALINNNATLIQSADVANIQLPIQQTPEHVAFQSSVDVLLSQDGHRVEYVAAALEGSPMASENVSGADLEQITVIENTVPGNLLSAARSDDINLSTLVTSEAVPDMSSFVLNSSTNTNISDEIDNESSQLADRDSNLSRHSVTRSIETSDTNPRTSRLTNADIANMLNPSIVLGSAFVDQALSVATQTTVIETATETSSAGESEGTPRDIDDDMDVIRVGIDTISSVGSVPSDSDSGSASIEAMPSDESENGSRELSHLTPSRISDSSSDSLDPGPRISSDENSEMQLTEDDAPRNSIQDSSDESLLVYQASEMASSTSIEALPSVDLETERFVNHLHPELHGYGAINSPHDNSAEEDALDVSSNSSDRCEIAPLLSSASSSSDVENGLLFRIPNNDSPILSREKFKRNDLYRVSLPLLMSLIIELPAVIVVVQSSSNLCSTIGKQRYQVVLATLIVSTSLLNQFENGTFGHQNELSEGFWMGTFEEMRDALRDSFLLSVVSGIMFGCVGLFWCELDFVFGAVISSSVAISCITSSIFSIFSSWVLLKFISKRNHFWAVSVLAACRESIRCLVMMLLCQKLSSILGSFDDDDFCI